MDGMEEIVQEFLVESHENLDQLDQDLLALEREPESRELLSSIFRTLHTIKGTSGFLALHTLERVAHAGESLLSKLRDGEMVLNPEMATALLEMVDAVRSLLGHIENDGHEGSEEYQELTAKLHALLEGRSPAAEAAAGGVEAASVAAPAVSAVAQNEQVSEPMTESYQESVTTTTDGATTTTVSTYEESMEAADGTSVSVTTVATEQRPAETNSAEAPTDGGDEHSGSGDAGDVSGDSDDAKNEAVNAVKAAATAQAGAAQAATAPAGDGGEKKSRSVADSSIRVDVDLLDSLMNCESHRFEACF